ncbi:unnamed protein product [Prorocentrum cordatum]|uniref:Uncharacterized protein n=1 Tax=Prorocentrum cordatum TaxID=2364126 RepID=A0ABN9X0D8_9DINO|nr:unnamed protein product [Polarella glacialis]
MARRASWWQRQREGPLPGFVGVRSVLGQASVVQACRASALSGLFSGGVQLLDTHAEAALPLEEVLPDNEVYKTFCFLLAFFVVLHTSHAYQRLMHGAEMLHTVVGELTELTNLLFAFARTAKSGPGEVRDFKRSIVRLVSLLFAVSVAEVEEGDSEKGLGFKLIDVMGIDQEVMDRVHSSDNKPEAVCHITYSAIVDAISADTLTIPAPLLTRVFQEFGNAMIKFNEVRTFKAVPFPAPYVMSARCLLFIHAVLTPLYMAHWTWGPLQAAVPTDFHTGLHVPHSAPGCPRVR